MAGVRLPARPRQPGAGRTAVSRGHIPGALFAHLDRDLSGTKTGANGRHPLPEPKTFVSWAGKQGLQLADQVVCYDGGSGAHAARLWWMLRWVGHENVAVLDGGFAKWQREGRAVTTDVPAITPVSYPGRAKTSMVAYLSHVEKKLKKAALLDARAPARYRGEHEPIDPVAGRIPGAKNRFNNDNLAADGTFKKPDVLRAEFEAILAGRNPADVINYCGSGVAACHNALAMEIAGLPDRASIRLLERMVRRPDEADLAQCASAVARRPTSRLSLFDRGIHRPWR
jgi:thiosulfate/3-mercaptopyruvate sulfurtransferase